MKGARRLAVHDGDMRGTIQYAVSEHRQLELSFGPRLTVEKRQHRCAAHVYRAGSARMEDVLGLAQTGPRQMRVLRSYRTRQGTRFETGQGGGQRWVVTVYDERLDSMLRPVFNHAYARC